MNYSVSFFRRFPPLALLSALTVALAGLGSPDRAWALPQSDSAPPQGRNADIGYPHFSGVAHPVPATGVAFVPGGYLAKVFEHDLATGAGASPGHDFWIDRMLARSGDAGGFGDSNNWLFTRGRAAYMYTHKPGEPGFVGDVAYWHKTGHDALFRLQLVRDGNVLPLKEVVAQRRQTPSYFTTTFDDVEAGVRMTLVKFFTQQNVAVAEVTLSSLDGKAHTFTLKAISPMAIHAGNGELTGAFQARNDITTVFPRMSGDGFAVHEGALVHEVTVPARGDASTLKVQLGMTTRELPASLAQYRRIQGESPQQAYREHVVAYNRWWADNIPYLDTPEDNIDKTLFYRWWLLRFNFLDADVPGNDYQFPVAIEGVLGYDNAIVLTTCMFLDDLKYLRDPSYAYGSWIGAGEVAASGKYVDNPGSPQNWSNSYAQYITAAAWRSYLVHGGPAALAGKLARYGRDDVDGLLKAYDKNGNGLIEYDWAAMTGNDGDAVSFDWAKAHGQVRMDRTESAYVWANAKAAAQAAKLSGDTATADEMEQVAAKIRASVLSVLWQDHSDAPDSMGLHGDLLKHRQASGPELPVDWKEINNYYPFTVGLMPKAGDADYDPKYVQALRLFADRGQFPIFPFYTADQADKHARGDSGSNNFSVINSTVLFRMLGSVLRQYPSHYLDVQWYRKLLYWNAWAHYINGDNRYPDQNEFWAKGSADDGGSIGYRSWIHHTQLGATNFTMIEDVMGLRPRSDAKIELYPIDIGWDHFAADNIRYRDHDLAIVWDKDGRHYAGAVPKGYSVYLDGSLAFTVDRLAHVVYDPASGKVQVEDDAIDHARAEVVTARRRELARPDQVPLAADGRVAEVLADAGIDLTLPSAARDVALGTKVSASFATDGFAADAAVDGSTVNEPFWGTAGSPSPSDWLELDLGAPKKFDEALLYFYRSSSPPGEAHGFPSGTRAGYAPPWIYSLQYRDHGQWRDVPGQVRDADIAQGNRNRVRFPAITAQHLRLKVVHAGTMRTGVKEIQLFASGHAAMSVAGNHAPSVVAWQEDREGASASVRLQARVGDDGLPAGTLSLHWTQVAGPKGGEAIFDNPASMANFVRFTEPGNYRLQLCANDGARQGCSDVTVTAPVQGAGQGMQVQGDAQVSAERTATHHRIEALNDGVVPAAGEHPAADHRWGSWGGTQPSTVWLQYRWRHPQRISASALYFWDDQPQGDVKLPGSWKLQYLDGSHWVDIVAAGGYPAAVAGKPARVRFAPLTTIGLRVVMSTATKGDHRAALGVDEWQVFADAPERVEHIDVRTSVGQPPALPGQVMAWYADGSSAMVGVTWPQLDAGKLGGDGRVDIHGLADGGLPVAATVWVRATPPGQVNTVDAPDDVHAAPGQALQLPGFATVQYNDGSRERRPIVWEQPPVHAPSAVGSTVVEGEVSGQGTTGSLPVHLKVIVQSPQEAR